MMAICPAGPPNEIQPSLTQKRSASEKRTCRAALSFLMLLQSLDREGVEASPDAVDVDEGERARVRAVGQEEKDALGVRVNPAARAGEAEVAEGFGREPRAGRRLGRRGELPRERARLVQALGHVRPEE